MRPSEDGRYVTTGHSGRRFVLVLEFGGVKAAARPPQSMHCGILPVWYSGVYRIVGILNSLYTFCVPQ
jgi:hypothetical protein